MSKNDDIIKQNEMLKELTEQNPKLMYLTDIGIILQDYISAKIMCVENAKNPIYESFTVCLFFVVADRYKELWRYVH